MLTISTFQIKNDINKYHNSIKKIKKQQFQFFEHLYEIYLHKLKTSMFKKYFNKKGNLKDFILANYENAEIDINEKQCAVNLNNIFPESHLAHKMGLVCYFIPFLRLWNINKLVKEDYSFSIFLTSFKNSLDFTSYYQFSNFYFELECCINKILLKCTDNNENIIDDNIKFLYNSLNKHYRQIEKLIDTSEYQTKIRLY